MVPITTSERCTSLPTLMTRFAASRSPWRESRPCSVAARRSVFDRPFLKCEQTIDVCHLRAERVARLLSARRRVEERAVLGAHAVGANVCVMPPLNVFPHGCVSVSFLSDMLRHRAPPKGRARSHHACNTVSAERRTLWCGGSSCSGRGARTEDLE